MTEKQRLARQQLAEARQRSRPVRGYSIFGDSTEPNPYPCIPPIHLYVLYSLPASKFVYVGQTTRVQQRYLEHLQGVDRPDINQEKADWLTDLKRMNVTPHIKVLETLYGNRIQTADGWWRKAHDYAKTLEWVWAAVAEANGFLVVNFSNRIARYGIRPAIDDQINARIAIWNRLIGERPLQT